MPEKRVQFRMRRRLAARAGGVGIERHAEGPALLNPCSVQAIGKHHGGAVLGDRRQRLDPSEVSVRVHPRPCCHWHRS